MFADDGLLLTNAHVVGPVQDGVAAFTDGTERRFDVVGSDPLPPPVTAGRTRIYPRDQRSETAPSG
ncbi:MAG: hypothetical protein ACRDS9_06820 [Pseudonocardiaceae bacterium]